MRDLTRRMQQSIPAHIDAMHRVMVYCVQTRNRGAILKPNCEWDGKKDFKLMIGGRSDSDYATNPDTRKSVTVCRVLLNRSPMAWHSSTQNHVTLSVTEADMGAGVTCVQEMMYAFNLMALWVYRYSYLCYWRWIIKELLIWPMGGQFEGASIMLMCAFTILES